MSALALLTQFSLCSSAILPHQFDTIKTVSILQRPYLESGIYVPLCANRMINTARHSEFLI